MRKKLTFIILALLSLTFYGQDPPAGNDPLPGMWLGVMKVSEQMSLQLAYEIENKDGSYSAKLNVVEQKAFDIPMDTCIIDEDSVLIRLNAAGIIYKGFYSSEEDKIFGTYTQGGGSFNLDLARVDALPSQEVERPQRPVPPFPYDEEEITFENSKAGILLAGTLTKPSGGKDLPAVILIAGSGKNDRNETSMGHFLLLSDFLTRNGYAVLRYDKRGVGESEGDYGLATTFEFADDARAAIKYLANRPEIDVDAIGLIGHSEGALIAPMIAAENPSGVSCIIMMGGIGLPGAELLLIQSRIMAEISGVPEGEISAMTEINRTFYEIAKTADSDSVMVQKLKETDPDIDDNLVNMLMWPWFRTFLSLDPSIYLEKVECPVLAITGEKDVQCPPGKNLDAIESALKKGGNEHFEIKVLPGLNHLFQTAKSGSPIEYDQIPEIISPDALQLILDWLDQLVLNQQ